MIKSKGKCIGNWGIKGKKWGEKIRGREGKRIKSEGKEGEVRGKLKKKKKKDKVKEERGKCDVKFEGESERKKWKGKWGESEEFPRWSEGELGKGRRKVRGNMKIMRENWKESEGKWENEREIEWKRCVWWWCNYFVVKKRERKRKRRRIQTFIYTNYFPPTHLSKNIHTHTHTHTK